MEEIRFSQRRPQLSFDAAAADMLPHLPRSTSLLSDGRQRAALLARLIKLFPEQSAVPYAKYQLNVSASNLIAVDRPLPDFRSEECRRLEIRRLEAKEDLRLLPDATVIVPFYDESWSMLLRTVHGVLDRSPPELVRELILVDDASSFDYLGNPLNRFALCLTEHN
jgi:hypothetical protein